jgi:hypothetical protein
MRGRRGAPPLVPMPTPGPGNDPVTRFLTGLRRNISEQTALMRAISVGVGTLDLIVYEHITKELDPTVEIATVNLTPQTSQLELIQGIYAAIVVPTLAAAPTITITNAWAKLGDDYINLNSIINSSAGTGGMLPGEYAFVLKSQATRQLNLVTSSDWPAGAYVTFALFGKVIPASIPGVLH